MAKLRFRGLQAGDVAFLAAHLRADDVQELAATRGPNVHPADAISRAVLLSSHAWVAASEGGRAIAIFGVAPVSLLNGIGSPWLLATDEAFRHPRSLVVEGRRYLSVMRAIYSDMVNYVDARNVRSVRWLKHLGFTLHPAAPYGIEDEPFHKFEIKGAE